MNVIDEVSGEDLDGVALTVGVVRIVENDEDLRARAKIHMDREGRFINDALRHMKRANEAQQAVSRLEFEARGYPRLVLSVLCAGIALGITLDHWL